jgi:hypothetical protein
LDVAFAALQRQAGSGNRLQVQLLFAAGDRTGAVANQQRTINKRRESAERRSKRDRIREQIQSGELRVRKATAAERRQWQQEREQRE